MNQPLGRDNSSIMRPSDWRYRPLIIALLALMLIGRPWTAAPTVAALEEPAHKVCPDGEVLSIHFTIDEDVIGFRDGELEISASPKSASAGSNRGPTKISVLGPILGSMDARDVVTQIDCLEGGFVLTLIVTRSANYSGSTTKNVLWRPKVELEIVSPLSQVVVRTVWRMRLSNGSELTSAQTLPFQKRAYPSILTKTIDR